MNFLLIALTVLSTISVITIVVLLKRLTASQRRYKALNNEYEKLIHDSKIWALKEYCKKDVTAETQFRDSFNRAFKSHARHPDLTGYEEMIRYGESPKKLKMPIVDLEEQAHIDMAITNLRGITD